ncbi:hypothetical protein CRD18_11070 (plasmid) [Corynebacterium sp. LK31]|nr:hypothetical protein [Corynebacterium sp. LK31]
MLAELKQWAVGADVECGFDVLDCLVEVFEFGVELVGIGGVTYSGGVQFFCEEKVLSTAASCSIH